MLRNIVKFFCEAFMINFKKVCASLVCATVFILGNNLFAMHSQSQGSEQPYNGLSLCFPDSNSSNTQSEPTANTETTNNVKDTNNADVANNEEGAAPEYQPNIFPPHNSIAFGSPHYGIILPVPFLNLFNPNVQNINNVENQDNNPADKNEVADLGAAGDEKMVASDEGEAISEQGANTEDIADGAKKDEK